MKISVGLWLMYPESVNVPHESMSSGCTKTRKSKPVSQKYRVHQGLSGLSDLIWLLYSSTARKTN